MPPPSSLPRPQILERVLSETGRVEGIMLKNDGRFHDRLNDEIRSRQRNTLWPDVLKNSFAVDVLLWHGSRNASRVQKIGAIIFGVTLLIEAVALLYLGVLDGNPVTLLFGALILFGGLRLCYKTVVPTSTSDAR
jgi:hypothetical protein